ncbi:universal stress protein [Pseudoruegeria sp. SK021]|uniref:universal stress protein n=1 Tax=Pseudoruegeria sp. SK021 TaxID=1933035 RepID=UPI000A237CE9|nr:universal stress protein [Pseudoruegeria sp. SK021]OSP55956.1 universal stress protein [Pseudoruegeria sp. SK021]
MPNTIVAAYDGSAAAGRAVEVAITRASAADAKLVIVHVLEWSPYSFLTPEEIEERHGRRKEEISRAEDTILKPLIADLARKGVTVEAMTRFGHVVETLVKVARDVGASEIIVGRTGQTGFAARIFGSVAGSLAQIAPVPCTIVP